MSKIEVYGNKWVKDRLQKLIVDALKDYPIVEACIYVKDIPKACLECMYFPCCKEERCKYAIG
jgi:hypothetical protein